MTFCNCDEWQNLKEAYPELFVWHPPYGWIMSWVSVTKESGFSHLHRYGIPIKFCPICGSKLLKEPISSQ